jgi:hypothetical protein
MDAQISPGRDPSSAVLFSSVAHELLLSTDDVVVAGQKPRPERTGESNWKQDREPCWAGTADKVLSANNAADPISGV